MEINDFAQHIIIIPRSVIFLGLPFIRAPGHGEVVRGDEGGGGGGAGQHLAHRGGAGGRARAAAHAVARHLQCCRIVTAALTSVVSIKCLWCLYRFLIVNIVDQIFYSVTVSQELKRKQ